jgi:hypothetical protein
MKSRFLKVSLLVAILSIGAIANEKEVAKKYFSITYKECTKATTIFMSDYEIKGNVKIGKIVTVSKDEFIQLGDIIVKSCKVFYDPKIAKAISDIQTDVLINYYPDNWNR